MASTTTTDTVVQAASQRAESNPSGDGVRVSYRTLMRGTASSDDRQAHIIQALRAAGLVAGTFEPTPLPSLVGEDGTVAEKVWNRTFTAERLEILRCAYEGLSYTQTAERVHKNVSTVKSHTLNLHRIFGVSSKPEMIIEAVRCGLLPGAPAERAPRARRPRAAQS